MKPQIKLQTLPYIRSIEKLQSFIFLEKDDESSEKEEEDNDEKIDIDIEKMNSFFKEYEMINQLQHPNIIKTYGFCYGDKSHMPSILLEYCPHNLKSCLKTLKKKKNKFES